MKSFLKCVSSTLKVIYRDSTSERGGHSISTKVMCHTFKNEKDWQARCSRTRVYFPKGIIHNLESLSVCLVGFLKPTLCTISMLHSGKKKLKPTRIDLFTQLISFSPMNRRGKTILPWWAPMHETGKWAHFNIKLHFF